MRKAVCIGLLLIGSTTLVFSQTTYASTDTVYRQAVEQGLAALKEGDCGRCLAHYQRAFAVSQKSAVSTLRAATCAYQCGQVQQARTYLQKATEVDWWISEDVWRSPPTYPELAPLRASALAADFQVSLDKQKRLAGRDPALERELQQVFEADQQPRLRLDSLGRRYGFNAPQLAPLYAQMQQADSINTITIERILQTYGYPGTKLVGEKLNSTAWVVVQHAPLPLQEKYLPLMQAAAAQGELPKSNIALLVDRIRVRKGQKQLYGSQVHLGTDGKPAGFEPIEDEADVNKRRAQMALPPLEDYAKQWGFEYALPGH